MFSFEYEMCGFMLLAESVDILRKEFSKEMKELKRTICLAGVES